MIGTKHQNLISIIGYIAVIEIVMCGGGQIIHVTGNITLRMLLFSIMLLFSFMLLNKMKIRFNDSIVFLGYLTLTLISSSISLINNNDIEKIIEDIKPQLYILVFPFMCHLVSSKTNIEIISKIIRIGALCMAIIYIIYLLSIKYFGFISFTEVYISLKDESDFLFRGEEGELFYKGFVFLPMGLVFYLQKKSFFPILILLIAVYFTFTRGFYIITLCGISFYYILFPKFSFKRFSFFVFGALGAMIIYKAYVYSVEEVIGNRDESDMIRIITFNQVMEQTTFFSTIWGHGFGFGVPIRPIHMESSYLEIFHKQGIIGLIYWGCLFIYTNIVYSRINISERKYAVPFLICIYMIYLQSFFNPYLTNPIGITMIFVGYIVLNYIYSNSVRIKNNI